MNYPSVDTTSDVFTHISKDTYETSDRRWKAVRCVKSSGYTDREIVFVWTVRLSDQEAGVYDGLSEQVEHTHVAAGRGDVWNISVSLPTLHQITLLVYLQV